MNATDLRNLVQNSPALRDQTKKMYLVELDRYLAFAGRTPGDWNVGNTQRFYQSLLDGGMKPQSANRVLAALAYVGKWYARHTGNAYNDFSKIQQARNKARGTREALTEAQARALLATCHRKTPRDLRDFAMLVTLLETGMRRVSLVSMTWEHTGPQVALVRDKAKDELSAVPTSETMLAACRPWMSYCGPKGRVQGPVWREVRKTLSGIVLGDTALTRNSIYNITDDRAAEAGLRGAHPHLFRHTFVTWRMAAGVPPHVIAASTGHRLPGAGMLNTYFDRTSKTIVDEARVATPPWLSEVVREWVGS